MKKILLSAAAALALCSCGNQVANTAATGSRAGSEIAVEYEDSIHFRDLYANADMKYTFDKVAPGNYARWEKAFRAFMEDRLGLTKIKAQLEGYVPKVEAGAIEDCGDFTRQDYVIWTEPTMPLPMVVMMPKNIEGKVPLVLAIQGHSKNPKLFAGVYANEAERISGEEGQRNIGVQAMREGYIAIVPTTRGFGDTRNAKDRAADRLSSCRDMLVNDLLVGRTPIGDRVWDMMKIIDWASEALPIDTKNIIATGNSGGGTVSLFEGAMDKRVAMTLPGSYFCTFKGSIGAMHHCECNYIPGILDYCEMYDIAGLTAPRLFRAIHGKKDNIFPIECTEFAFGKLQEIYKAAGAPDNCSLYVGPEGHRYYSDGAWDYIREHLNK